MDLGGLFDLVEIVQVAGEVGFDRQVLVDVGQGFLDGGGLGGKAGLPVERKEHRLAILAGPLVAFRQFIPPLEEVEVVAGAHQHDQDDADHRERAAPGQFQELLQEEAHGFSALLSLKVSSNSKLSVASRRLKAVSAMLAKRAPISGSRSRSSR